MVAEPLSNGALQLAVRELVAELLEVEPNLVHHPKIAAAFLTTVYSELAAHESQRASVQDTAVAFGRFLLDWGTAQSPYEMAQLVRRSTAVSGLAEGRARIVG